MFHFISPTGHDRNLRCPIEILPKTNTCVKKPTVPTPTTTTLHNPTHKLMTLVTRLQKNNKKKKNIITIFYEYCTLHRIFMYYFFIYLRYIVIGIYSTLLVVLLL